MRLRLLRHATPFAASGLIVACQGIGPPVSEEAPESGGAAVVDPPRAHGPDDQANAGPPTVGSVSKARLTSIDGHSDPDGGPEAGSDPDAGSDAGTGGPVVLVTGLFPTKIALGDDDVYWIAGGSNTGYEIRKCAKSGCGGVPTVVAPSSALINPQDIAVHNNVVYWTDYGHLNMADGAVRSSAGDLATGLGVVGVDSFGTAGHPMRIAVDDAYVYWSTGQHAGPILRCAIGGCGGVPEAFPMGTGSVTDPRHFVINSTHLFWGVSYQDILFACPISGCVTRKAYASNGEFTGATLAADPSYVFFSTNEAPSRIQRCAATGCTGNVTTLATATGFPLSMVSDGTYLYWTDAGRLLQCAVAGCGGNPTAIATGLTNATPVAVDADWVYWSKGSSLVKSAKNAP